MNSVKELLFKSRKANRFSRATSFLLAAGMVMAMQQAWAQEKLKPVLEDAQLPRDLSISAKAGYQAAKACPEVCNKLFCYCGCDNTDGHVSLLDCFTSDHGVDCAICQKEAMIGLKMKKQNKSIGEIQKAVDAEFRKEYPWDEKSDAYKKYLGSIGYKDTPAGRLDKSGLQDSASSARDKTTGTTSDAKESKKGKSPTLRKGMTAGSCCGAKHDSK